MKYAIKYDKQLNIIDKVDELVIDYNKKDTTIFTFMQKYKNKRFIINMDYTEDYIDDINRFVMIKEKDPNLNFTIAVPSVNYSNMIDYLKSTNINFMSKEHVYNWDIFNLLITLGVSDIYVVEDLCFQLDKVYSIANKNNVNIRVFPNVAQSHVKGAPDYKKFFIRPEEVDSIEYIDILELYGNKSLNVLYQIYAIDKKWYGNLKEIIINLDNDLDNRCLIPSFTKMRTMCEKKCNYGKCELCKQMLDLSNIMGDKGIIFEKK